MNARASRHGSAVLARATTLAMAAFAAASCQAIAGIEERTFNGTGGQQSALCQDYCETVMDACLEVDDPDPDKQMHFSVYPSMDACMKYCEHLDEGDMAEKPRPRGDTVACRLTSARLAKSSREFGLYCPQAGPGGAGVCGDDCANYCTHFEELCGPVPADCPQKCKVIKNLGSFDAIRDHDGDTLQCRLVHLTNASLDETHCGHAQFISNQYCVAQEVTCEEHCRIVMTTCSGALKVYDNEDQCLAACQHLDPGEPDDVKEDTVGCRTYHAYNSFVTNDPATHCPHAGPGGDNHCGTGNCPAYCTLLEAACESQFASTYGTNAKCLEECANLEGAGGETHLVVATAEGDNVMCRLVQISRSFEDPSLCPTTVGLEGPCR